MKFTDLIRLPFALSKTDPPRVGSIFMTSPALRDKAMKLRRSPLFCAGLAVIEPPTHGKPRD
jgi:hypothetical protein